jgi:hypothetical protein
VILKTTLRDRDGSSGSPGRRAQSLELTAECAADLEVLGELAVILASRGATTTAAARELVANLTPEPQV